MGGVRVAARRRLFFVREDWFMVKYRKGADKGASVVPAEPKARGKWVRFDSRTLIFVKEGQDVEAVLERYRQRPTNGDGLDFFY